MIRHALVLLIPPRGQPAARPAPAPPVAAPLRARRDATVVGRSTERLAAGIRMPPVRRGRIAAAAARMRRALPVSVAFHLLLAAAIFGSPLLFAGPPPPPPEVLAQVELVLGTAAPTAPVQSPAPQAATPTSGIADAAPGPRAQAPDVTPESPASAATAPPTPAPPDPAAAPLAPGAPTKATAASRPRVTAPPAKETTAATPVDAPGMPPSEPVPMPEVRLDDGNGAPPAEILDLGSRIKVAEAESGNTVPQFPIEAARLHETGTVVLRLHVDPQGRVSRVEILRSSGSASIDRVSRERLATWRFHPAMLAGHPVEDIVDQSLRFVAQ